MQKSWKGRQISITARQAEGEEGADLLALTQSIAEDGRLSEKEFAALRDWLSAHRGSSLPAVAFLSDTLERVLGDGQVTPSEWKDLHEAVIRVLPPEIRRGAKDAKAAQERREYYRQEQERRDAEQRANTAWDFMVAGVSYEGRSSIIDRNLHVGDAVELRREPENRFDPNAVAVRLASGEHIGYVPSKYAREMAPLLDSGTTVVAWCKKILAGLHSVPVIVASFVRQTEGGLAMMHLPSTPPPDALPQISSPPEARKQSPTPGRSWTPPSTSASPGVQTLFWVAVAAVTVLALAAMSRR